MEKVINKIGIGIISLIFVGIAILLVSQLNLTGFSIINQENCGEFTEEILFSSGFSNEANGSTSYQTWYPKNNCSGINSSTCTINKLEIETRFLYFGEENETGEAYIKISNASKTVCTSPEKGVYERYLAYETLKGEEEKFAGYCGNNKNQDEKCGVEPGDEFAFRECYGIKLYADQYFLVDAFELKYWLCGGNQ